MPDLKITTQETIPSLLDLSNHAAHTEITFRLAGFYSFFSLDMVPLLLNACTPDLVTWISLRGIWFHLRCKFHLKNRVIMLSHDSKVVVAKHYASDQCNNTTSTRRLHRSQWETGTRTSHNSQLPCMWRHAQAKRSPSSLRANFFRQ